MPLPTLTPEQRKQALKKAQETRHQRAQIRQQLKRGQITFQKVMKRSSEGVIGGMRVSYLLESMPKVGKARGRKIMEDIGIHPTRRVSGLGSRQVEALRKRLG